MSFTQKNYINDIWRDFPAFKFLLFFKFNYQIYHFKRVQMLLLTNDLFINLQPA
ncbi:hypothetical protein CCS77_1850 [Campylobacter concisus]|uniref:Uncharacterized protein n=1 Tax=Campylobacter concisus TaxID=199 RepID=A0A2R4P356_9BACT|nr:hypothetical protein CCS77_1850 [Campylobacter concisus]